LTKNWRHRRKERTKAGARQFLHVAKALEAAWRHFSVFAGRARCLKKLAGFKNAGAENPGSDRGSTFTNRGETPTSI